MFDEFLNAFGFSDVVLVGSDEVFEWGESKVDVGVHFVVHSIGIFFLVEGAKVLPDDCFCVERIFDEEVRGDLLVAEVKSGFVLKEQVVFV